MAKKKLNNKEKKSKEKVVLDLNTQEKENSDDKIWDSMTIFQNNDNHKSEEILSERNKIKNVLINNLTKQGFTEPEIAQVLEIVTEAEKNIQYAKDSLIGTNINNDDPTIIMHKVFEEIRRMQAEMAVKMRHKIYEIQLAKTDPEKYAKLMEVNLKTKKTTKSKKKV